MSALQFPSLATFSVRELARYGQKAALLAQARALGLAVPAGFALTGEQASALVAGEPAARAALDRALDQLSRDDPESAGGLAVRSSPHESLPGALLTRLGVEAGPEHVTSAVREVLASVAAPAAVDQRRARGRAAQGDEDLPVLVQRYVRAAEPGDFGAVLFTRDPASGAPGLFGEYLPGAGADALVSGKRVPLPLSGSAGRPGLEQTSPAEAERLRALGEQLERHFEEPLELELVQVGGVLWLLQVRPLVMSPRALIRLSLEAIDADSPKFRRFVSELAEADLSGLVERNLPPPEQLEGIEPCLRGLAASPGVASGRLIIDPARALAEAADGPVVLMRTEAVPEEVAAFKAAEAIVTTSGGLTSHAAVVARGLRVPAVVGCADVRVDAARRVAVARSEPQRVLVAEGELVTVDAHRGLVYRGALTPLPRVASAELRQLFVQLRKLRRVPLWAYGPPAVALRAKEDGCLDGVICPVTSLDGLPAPQGRECWVELASSDALALAPALPGGWGIVVRGELSELPLTELRALSRLRPLGVHLSSAPLSTLPPIALDLAVFSAPVGAATPLSGLAPRALVHVENVTDSPDFGPSGSVGVLCGAERSLEAAMRVPLLGSSALLRS